MSLKFLTATILVLMVNIASGQDEKRFDGLNAGFEMGAQNIFSGALIDGIDVIKHQHRLATEMTLGFRKQLLKSRLLIGANIRFGLIDGQLNRQYNNGIQDIAISYESSTQSGFGINLGTVLGKQKSFLVGLYLIETNRSFDIIWIEANNARHNQEDSNGFARYGVFAEKPLKNRLHLYLTLGNVYIDFGDAITTEKVSDILEFAVGVKYQLPF